jgi:hypothetical protein
MRQNEEVGLLAGRVLAVVTKVKFDPVGFLTKEFA